MVKRSLIIKNLLVFGSGHFLIDAISALILFSLVFSKTQSMPSVVLMVVLYNILAFGTQIVFGELIDKYKVPKKAAMIGTLLAIIAILSFKFSTMTSIILIGLGNAIYHIGIGTIGLNLTPKKASAPGILVAPGAIGLLIGTLVAKNYGFIYLPFTVASVLYLLLIYATKIPKIDYKTDKHRTNNTYYIIVSLLLLTILIRSFIGSVMLFPWKSDLILLITLTVFVFLGKSLGGILADKFGFIKTGVVSLIISSILLSFGQNIPFISIIGMFLFNMTMPITLVALSNSLPGRPGFAFGLTCMALLIGSMPILLNLKIILSNYILLTIIVISALFLYLSLKIQKTNHKNKKRKREK
jgi:FSR family fosmidomycin resistance protein-like MFS transporter